MLNLFNYFRLRPRLTMLLVFAIVWIVASIVFFVRSPNNALSPNFYAEDGIDFMTNILKHGPFSALMIPFNGYFIVGLYLIGDLALLLNTALFGSHFIHLPKSIAIASYIFMGLCAALPILTLNKILKPAYLALVVLGITFVPMPLNDNVIIGTLGNLKFGFAFLAVLLMAKRWGLNRDSKLIPILDVGILLCAYTTATVYLLIPFYLFCDGLRPRQLLNWRKTWRLSNLSLWSAATLAVLLLIQLVYVATHGIPALPGYLDSPFEYSKAIEIFIGRTIIFGLVPNGYRFLNDILAVSGVILLAGIAIWATRKWSLLLAVLCAYTALMASVLFLFNRPGLSGLFQHYAWSGPDQFFYAQTMLTTVMGCVLLQSLAAKFKRRWIEVGLFSVVTLLLVLGIPTGSFYGKDKTWEKTRGTIYTAAKVACKEPGDILRIESYPIQPWHVNVPRTQVCNQELDKYHTYRVVDRGLTARANYPIEIGSKDLKQPFSVSNKNDLLAGVEVFFSTYNQNLRSRYLFTLYDADCKKTITTTIVDGKKLKDNSFVSVYFKPIRGNLDYCFAMSPQSKPSEPLAVQLSSTNQYALAPARIDGETAANPIVFLLILED